MRPFVVGWWHEAGRMTHAGGGTLTCPLAPAATQWRMHIRWPAAKSAKWQDVFTRRKPHAGPRTSSRDQ